MKTFEAKYPGRCAACPDPIDVGDILAYDDDRTVVHVECHDDYRNKSPRKPAEVCPRCFIEQSVSGACAC